MQSEEPALVDRAVEQAIKFDYHQKDMGAYYDTFDTDVYDEMLVQINFSELFEIVKAASAMDQFKDRRDTVEVMDIGCGTGRVGEEMSKVGWKIIDGVDPSENLLQATEKKGHYRNLTKLYLGNGEFPKPEMKEKYELVVSSGVWVQGHIPKEGIEEVVQCMKPGGYWVLALRSKHLVPEQDDMGYAETFARLQETGKLKVVNSYTFMRGNKASETDKNPLFSEQESTLLIYQLC